MYDFKCCFVLIAFIQLYCHEVADIKKKAILFLLKKDVLKSYTTSTYFYTAR